MTTEAAAAGMDAAERLKNGVEAAVSVRHILSHPGEYLPAVGEVQSALDSLRHILETAATSNTGGCGSECRDAASDLEALACSEQRLRLPGPLLQRFLLLQAFRVFEEEANAVLKAGNKRLER